MEDSVYIYFFVAPSAAAAGLVFDRAREICDDIVIKHRPNAAHDHQYSIQYRQDGFRFLDDDLDKINQIVIDLGGRYAGSKTFYDREDFD